MTIRTIRVPAEGRALLILFCLCVCVFLQVLGVPATLLDPVDGADPLASSLLEGFTIPPASLEAGPSPKDVPASDRVRLLSLPVLTSALFHPPVR